MAVPASRNGPLNPTDAWFLEGLTATQPQTDTDNDGLPDDWESSHNLDPHDPTDANRVVGKGKSIDDRHMGYSYVEYYINQLADNLTPKSR